jgi:hypothetical protein
VNRKVLTVATGEWLTSSQSTVGAPHAGKLRMNIEIKPTYAVDYDPVAPHGLLGQTYDRDAFAVDGRRDDYSRLDSGRSVISRAGAGGDVTTHAKAQGAIEGTLEEYRMASNFVTAFRYSRFDALASAVRNVTALGGTIMKHHTHSHPGRERAGRA